MNRRTLLRGACGTALALPFLDALRPMRAQASTAGVGCPKRILVFVQGNGVRLAPWIPTHAGSSYTLGPAMAPLAGYEDRMTIVAGLDNMIPPLNSAGNGHQNAELTLLTGVPFHTQTAPLVAGGPSFDRLIEQHLTNPGFARLDLGIGRTNSGVHNSVYFHSAAETPVSVIDDPINAFNTIFGTGTTPAANQRRARVIDTVLGQFNQLRNEVDVADRLRLDRHVDQLDQLQHQLDNLQSSGACDTSGITIPTGYNPEADQHLAAPAMIDIMVHALACDLTRVGTLEYSNTHSPGFHWTQTATGGPVVPAGYDNWHGVVHDLSGVVDDELLAGSTFYFQQLRYLLDRLAERTDVDGDNLLDTTLVVYTSDFGNGAGHNTRKIPVVLAGAVGPLGGGRFLDQFMNGDTEANWTASDHSMNQLYVSLMQLFGMGNATFGDASVPQGPLPGLI